MNYMKYEFIFWSNIISLKHSYMLKGFSNDAYNYKHGSQSCCNAGMPQIYSMGVCLNKPR